MKKISSNYRPWVIEPKWQKKWQAKPLFKAIDFIKSNPAAGRRGKFYCLVEFPYPSGEGLHIGHAFTNTIMDVFSRKKRMEGFNVLQPMGWDAFGLPTENYAIKAGVHPAIVTRKNTRCFREQNERLGMSYDWSREIDTTDPDYYRWTQWIFIQFFRHGLAYKAQMPVGWCPACKIILANEEIVAGKCERCGAPAERKMQSQWLLRITAYADRLADELDLVDYPDYVKTSQRNWIGRTKGIEIDYPVLAASGQPHSLVEKISCYSTRPETNFGATFVVIAPEHSLTLKLTEANNLGKVRQYLQNAQKKSELERTDLLKEKTGVFTGSYVLNRLTGKKMPIWVSDFVVLTAGTGVVVGVPAHDERDWQFARQYNLEIVPVLKPQKGIWDFQKAAYTDINNAVVFNSGFLNGLPALKAQGKIISYLVKKGWGRRAVNYHLRDWIFSRQHYWGEPIPMIYCSECAQKGISWWETEKGKKFKKPAQFSRGLIGWFPVSEAQLPVKLPEVKKYQSTDTGESPLANISQWVKTTCPHCGGPARRETDTMPNWAGSSWYFLRYLDPKNNQALADPKKMKYWLPVDLYLGGAEHTTLHLLYSRFWHKFLNDIKLVPGKEPYAVRRQHGVILGEDGFRMSKSRGNVITPETVVEKFGADTLRLYLVFMGPYDATMLWSTKGVEGIWRFLNRIWRLVSQHQGTKISISGPDLERLSHQTIKKVTEDIDSLKYNTAIASIMAFVNQLTGQTRLTRKTLETLVLLLSPFAPFMAEALWCEVLGNPYSVHQQPWPKYDLRLAAEERLTVVIQVNGKVRGQIQLPAEKAADQSEVERQARTAANVIKHLGRKKIKKVIFITSKLINFVV